MKKLKLEDLRVESFEAESSTPEHGTVIGFQETGERTCDNRPCEPTEGCGSGMETCERSGNQFNTCYNSCYVFPNPYDPGSNCIYCTGWDCYYNSQGCFSNGCVEPQ